MRKLTFSRKEVAITVTAIMLILTNPTMEDFKDFLGPGIFNGTRRPMNCLLFSMYREGNHTYMGLGKNFFEVYNSPITTSQLPAPAYNLGDSYDDIPLAADTTQNSNR